MGDSRYHVRFKDEASGEELGLILTEGPQLGFTRRLINPYAAKMGGGDSQDSDLTEWSVVSQGDWRGGRGQEVMEDATLFYDAHNLETRIEGQLTLGPLPINPVVTDPPKFEPGNVEDQVLGWQGPVVNTEGGSADYRVAGDYEYAQSFEAGQAFGFDYHIASVEVYLKRDAGVTGNIKLAIQADSSGSPSGSDLASVTLGTGDVGTSYAWVTFTLASALDVSEGATYWMVLSSSEGGGTGHQYWWRVAAEGNPYGDGSLAGRDAGLVWRHYSEADALFKLHWAKVQREMSFVCPAGGMTCNYLRLYVRAPGWIGGEYKVSLCADSAGDPGAELQSETKAIATYMGDYFWLKFGATWAQALTGGNTYHIVVEPVSEPGARVWHVACWGADAGAGYATGAAQVKVGGGSWTAQTPDCYFRVNEPGLDGDVIAYIVYAGSFYCAAGDTVYVWNNGTQQWENSDEVVNDDVTALEVWGGYLWAARGAAHQLRRYNDTSWADAPGSVRGTLLRRGGGYLHRTGHAANDHRIYYTADGTTWTELGEVGAGDYAVTGMAYYRDMLFAATSVDLWCLAVEDMAYPVLDWSSQEDADNGRGLLAWSRTGCLYIPLRFGLYRWNGDTMMAVGPEQGMGLPAGRAGKVRVLVGTGNWLFAAIDAGASGFSSVMAYNGMGGWHELQRCEAAGQRMKALGFEVVHSPNRLWFGMGDQTRYLQLPDYSDNPWQWSGYEFNASGSLETSWMGGALLEVTKDLHEIVLRGEGFNSSQKVKVYYEVDRSGTWTYLGEVTEAPRQALGFESSHFGVKTVGGGSTISTIELASGSTTGDLAAGDWVRIGGEVRQVASVTDSDTFVLATALSAAPVAGDMVYPSRAAGREFRLRLVLETDDRTETPRVTRVFVRYQANVLDRFVYQLGVKVQDAMGDLAGNPYPHTAADLRAELDVWAQRHTPFTMYDPDGVGRTVKVIGVGDGGYGRKEGAGDVRYGSVYSMNLVEVA